jgi:hypothetical protein
VRYPESDRVPIDSTQGKSLRQQKRTASARLYRFLAQKCTTCGNLESSTLKPVVLSFFADFLCKPCQTLLLSHLPQPHRISSQRIQRFSGGKPGQSLWEALPLAATIR